MLVALHQLKICSACQELHEPKGKLISYVLEGAHGASFQQKSWKKLASALRDYLQQRFVKLKYSKG